MSIHSNKWILLFPVVLAVLVNLNVLRNGFVWDDIPMLSPEGGAAMAKQAALHIYYRPAVSLSYRLDRTLWGRNPFGFHLTGFALHAAATALVTMIAFRLFSGSRSGVPIAFLAGALFSVHPVHSEAVAWIAGRNDLLPSVFLLAAVLAHLARRGGAGSWWTLPVFAVGIGTALLGKEAAAPFLLIFPLYDLLLWERPGPRWRRLLTAPTAILAVFGLFFLRMRASALGSFSGTIPLREVTPMEGIGTILAATGFYIKHLVFPHPLNALISLSHMNPLVRGLYAVAGFLMIGLSVLLVLTGKARRLAVGLWSVLLGLAAALVISIASFVYAPVAERYLYLPSVGFVMIAAAGLFWLAELPPVRRILPRPDRIAWAIAIAWLLFFSYESFERNRIWRTEETLWEDTARKSPWSALPHNRLGREYARSGRMSDAQRELRLALDGEGDESLLSSAAINLGGSYFEEGRLDPAEKAYRKAILHQNRTEAHFGIGLINWERARRALQKSDPSSTEYLTQARVHLIDAITLDDTNVQAYHALSMVYLAEGNAVAARRLLRKVIALTPDSPLALDAARRLEDLGKGE